MNIKLSKFFVDYPPRLLIYIQQTQICSGRDPAEVEIIGLDRKCTFTLQQPILVTSPLLLGSASLRDPLAQSLSLHESLFSAGYPPTQSGSTTSEPESGPLIIQTDMRKVYIFSIVMGPCLRSIPSRLKNTNLLHQQVR